jgi:hypothetical protein
VAPPGVVAADIQYTGRVVVNGTTVVASIPTANKNGLLVFDGIAGQRINLGFSAVTIGQFNVMVYRPDGGALTLLPSVVTTTGGGLELPLLPMTGTYTILLDPVSTYTGNATVTVSTEGRRHDYVGRCGRSALALPRRPKCPLHIQRLGGSNGEFGDDCDHNHRKRRQDPQPGWVGPHQ